MLNELSVSVISQIEFLAFPGLSQADRDLFQQFLKRVEIIDLISADASLIQRIIEVRQQFRLKLPDAMIAAIALQHSANLVTADQEFVKVSPLTVTDW